MIVTIDPGHGGDDPGAVGIEPGGGRQECPPHQVAGGGQECLPHQVAGDEQECPPHQVAEAELNWELTEKLRMALEEDGHSPVLTRSQDQSVPLKTRAEAARGGHCMVSIHHNAAESRWARGFEIYVHKPEVGDISERDMALASLILEECRPALEAWGIPLRNPPIKADVDWASRGRLTLLAEAEVPACLLEMCFMSNPLELLAAQMPPFRWQMGQAIARGVTRFGKEVLHVL